MRKVTIIFSMSVSPSVRMEQLDPDWKDFHINFICENFSEIHRENSLFIKTWYE